MVPKRSKKGLFKSASGPFRSANGTFLGSFRPALTLSEPFGSCYEPLSALLGPFGLVGPGLGSCGGVWQFLGRLRADVGCVNKEPNQSDPFSDIL